jgi:hypothetical protein
VDGDGQCASCFTVYFLLFV